MTNEKTLEEELGLMDEAEYAKFRHKTILSVRNDRSKGKCPTYTKLGNRIMYFRKDVLAFVKAHTVTPKVAPTLTSARPSRRGARRQSATR